MEHGSLIDHPAEVVRDASAPDWANGYKVEDLKRITTLFERYDEGLVHGPFDRTAPIMPPPTSATAG